MHVYSLYGVIVRSEIELPNIPTTSCDNVDITVGVVDVLARTKSSAQTLVGSVPGVGRARITDGATIEFAPDSAASDADVSQAIVGACLGAALVQRGHLVLHACSVVVDGRAICMTGPSGSGKSTLTDAFMRAGAGLLSDDITVVSFDNGPTVMPGASQVRLLDNTSTKGKRTDSVAEDLLSPPAPLACVYRLAIGEGPVITPLAGATAFKTIAANTRVPSLLRVENASAGEHLHRAGALLREVPVRGFSRPRDLEALDHHVRMLIDDALA